VAAAAQLSGANRVWTYFNNDREGFAIKSRGNSPFAEINSMADGNAQAPHANLDVESTT